MPFHPVSGSRNPLRLSCLLLTRFLHVRLCVSVSLTSVLRVRLRPFLNISLFLFRLRRVRSPSSVSPLSGNPHITTTNRNRPADGCPRPSSLNFFHLLSIFSLFRLFPFHDTRNRFRKKPLFLIAQPLVPESDGFLFGRFGYSRENTAFSQTSRKSIPP